MTRWNHQTDDEDIFIMKYAMYLTRVEDPMTVAHTLKHGLQALDTYGWTQGKIQAVDQRVCAVGALMVGNGLTATSNASMPGSGMSMEQHPDIGPALIALAVMSGYQPTWLTSKAHLHEPGRIPVMSHVTSWNDQRDAYETDQGQFGTSYFVGHRLVLGRTVDEVRDLFIKTIAVLEVL
jgi:hypothetical protein